MPHSLLKSDDHVWSTAESLCNPVYVQVPERDLVMIGLLDLCVGGGECSIVEVSFSPPLSLEFAWSSDCDVCSGTVLR